ncbi:MAG TPA: GntR family transcriptional regulator [Thermomicrobiales bacterium]|nr:GntR family transcriptional regulator [Thermomicrobiales bacterium]
MQHNGALMATLPSLIKPTKADDAYDELKRLIVSLQISPGEPLNERTLMAKMDAGRTPLREAIQRLALEQLVTSLPRRGYYVRELSISELNEMIAARHVVEPAVTRMAVPNLTPSDLANLRELVALTRSELERDNHEAGIYHDLEFHRTIANACGNRYLAASAIQINTRLLRYWYVSFAMLTYEPPTFAHHDLLMDLIESGDAVAVEAAMHDHIEIFRDRMRQIVGNNVGFPARRELVSFG